MLSQGFSTSSGDEVLDSSDSLVLREEWWVGGNISAFYQQNFGTLTVQYVGSDAPGSVRLNANTQGGYGYGAGMGPIVEYRPFRSPLAFGLMLAGEVRTIQSTSNTPVSNDIYAFNAIFETHLTAWYATVAPFVRYQVSPAGAYIFGGITVDVPVVIADVYVWQHELPVETPTGSEPGRALTSIKFKTEADMRVRFGMQLGVGHDIMVGLFGYKNQLISPYFVLQGGTPIVASPTALNGFIARVGFIWKYGF